MVGVGRCSGPRPQNSLSGLAPAASPHIGSTGVRAKQVGHVATDPRRTAGRSPPASPPRGSCRAGKRRSAGPCLSTRRSGFSTERRGRRSCLLVEYTDPAEVVRSDSAPRTYRPSGSRSHGWSSPVWFGTKSRKRRSPRACSLRRGDLEPRRSSQVTIHRVVADAVGRADDVPRGRQLGQHAPAFFEDHGMALRDLPPRLAPLPNTHQPNRIEAHRLQGVPFTVRHRVQRHAGPVNAPRAPTAKAKC